MSYYNILFGKDGNPIAPNKISKKIDGFGYNLATCQIIQDSKKLDRSGEVFLKCTARILSNFGMTRSGPFKGVRIDENGNVSGKEILLNCWNAIGGQLIQIRSSIPKSGYPRDRYLLELDELKREGLISKIWSVTKQLLPFTMSKTSYGLVGASKILFSVLTSLVKTLRTNPVPVVSFRPVTTSPLISVQDTVSRSRRSRRDGYFTTTL